MKKQPETKKSKYKLHLKVPAGQTESLKTQLAQKGVSLSDSFYDDKKGTLTVNATDNVGRKQIRKTFKEMSSVKPIKEPKYSAKTPRKSQKDFDL